VIANIPRTSPRLFKVILPSSCPSLLGDDALPLPNLHLVYKGKREVDYSIDVADAAPLASRVGIGCGIAIALPSSFPSSVNRGAAGRMTMNIRPRPSL
jgi:hypothetical protein